jgi:hypothetical protein
VPKYEAGDYIKVEFLDETTGVGEWMWVRVHSCDDAPCGSALLLPDYCKYRLDSTGTKIANTTRPSLPIMYGSEGASNWIAADTMC